MTAELPSPRFRRVRVLVAAGCELEIARNVGACLHGLADGFHFGLQKHADDEGKDDGAERDESERTPRAAADGVSFGGSLQEFLTAGKEAVDAAKPVVGVEFLEEVIFEHRLSVLVKGVFRLRPVEKRCKLAVIHAQKQNHAVAVCALAEFIRVVDLPRGFVDAVVVFGIVVNGDDVDADAVVLRNALGVGLQLAVLFGGQNPRVVCNAVELAFCKD